MAKKITAFVLVALLSISIFFSAAVQHVSAMALPALPLLPEIVTFLSGLGLAGATTAVAEANPNVSMSDLSLATNTTTVGSSFLNVNLYQIVSDFWNRLTNNEQQIVTDTVANQQFIDSTSTTGTTVTQDYQVAIRANWLYQAIIDSSQIDNYNIVSDSSGVSVSQYTTIYKDDFYHNVLVPFFNTMGGYSESVYGDSTSNNNIVGDLQCKYQELYEIKFSFHDSYLNEYTYKTYYVVFYSNYPIDVESVVDRYINGIGYNLFENIVNTNNSIYFEYDYNSYTGITTNNFSRSFGVYYTDGNDRNNLISADCLGRYYIIPSTNIIPTVQNLVRPSDYTISSPVYVPPSVYHDVEGLTTDTSETISIVQPDVLTKETKDSYVVDVPNDDIYDNPPTDTTGDDTLNPPVDGTGILDGIQSWLDGFWAKLQSLLESLTNTLVGTGELDLTKFQNIGGGLPGLFPFCIPFDFVNTIASFNVPPQAPVWTFDLSGTVLGNTSIVIDLSKFESVAKVFRFFEFIALAIGLMFATRKFIKW